MVLRMLAYAVFGRSTTSPYFQWIDFTRPLNASVAFSAINIFYFEAFTFFAIYDLVSLIKI